MYDRYKIGIFIFFIFAFFQLFLIPLQMSNLPFSRAFDYYQKILWKTSLRSCQNTAKHLCEEGRADLNVGVSDTTAFIYAYYYFVYLLFKCVCVNLIKYTNTFLFNSEFFAGTWYIQLLEALLNSQNICIDTTWTNY